MIKDANKMLPEAEQITSKFTAGSLWNFQRRWILKSRKMCGEAADVNKRPIEEAPTHVHEVCDRYSSDYIFNADNTGRNYSMSPDRTISIYTTTWPQEEIRSGSQYFLRLQQSHRKVSVDVYWFCTTSEMFSWYGWERFGPRLRL